ncbi:hypothetical protein ACFX12_042052 [Malus domestica]
MPFNYVQASVLIIYNKEIQDLIHHDTDGNANVSGLTIVDVSKINQTSFLIQQVVYSKYTFWERAIFEKPFRVYPIIERLSRTSATGEWLEKTQAINKSLRNPFEWHHPVSAQSSVKRTTVNTLHLGVKNLKLDSPAPSGV